MNAARPGWLSYGYLEFTVPQEPCVDCKARYPRNVRTQHRCATFQEAHTRHLKTAWEGRYRRGKR